MIRHAGVIFGILIMAAIGCEDSPTSPSPLLPAFTLRAGSYTMTIVAEPSTASAPNPCVEQTTSADRVEIPVRVESMDKAWRIRPIGAADLGLVATVDSPDRNALVGPVSGQALDTTTGVIVTVDELPVPSGLTPAGPPSIFGTLESDKRVSGIVNGRVRFTLGAGHRVCATNRWSLDPR